MMKLKRLIEPMTEKDEKQEREFVMMCLAVTCGAGTLAEALRLLLAVMDWHEGRLGADDAEYQLGGVCHLLVADLPHHTRGETTPCVHPAERSIYYPHRLCGHLWRHCAERGGQLGV